MKTSALNGNVRHRHRFLATMLGSIIVLIATVGYTASSHNISRPASKEFGQGPRVSLGRNYMATLEAAQPLRLRKMQTVRVRIEDVAGHPVDGAGITIDGGMPQHGHGLPTRPRVTRNLGGGIYEIEGVRFNMGGWWQFKLAISGPAGDDSVTFNLDL
ncbi:MAG TPA: FixH family protein [Woeseiaceae bacterium]|nr:FixH family protein [Woeseiaceae bacterium]